MTDTELSLDDAEHVFLRSGSATAKSSLWLVGGLILLAVGVSGFVIACLTNMDQFAMHGISTLPTILAIGAITAWRALSRTPRQVSVGPKGIRIEGQSESRFHSWDEIGWATVLPTLMNTGSRLVIFDAQGKTLTKLGSGFDDYDSLVDVVTRRIADKGDDTSDRIQARKAKRSAVLMVAMSVCFLGLAGFIVWMAHHEQRAAALLKTDGVPGEAQVEDRRLAPNGVTPRLEYRITTADGRTAIRNAEVTRQYWDQLEGVTSVAVVFVPSEPEISRLATGEVADNGLSDNPKAMYALSALIACVCCFFLVAAVLQWKGWDIDMDSKSGKISIKQFGTGR